VAGSKEKIWIIDDSGESSGQSNRKPRGPKRRSVSPSSRSGNSPWLAVPKPNGASAPKKKKRAKPSNGNGKRPATTPQTGLRRTQARLRKALGQIEAKDKRIAELETRVSELEAASKAEPKPKPQPKAEKPEPKAEKPEPKPKPEPKARKPKRAKQASRNGRFDVNTITFEELRALGLSVTQSARLIGTRDTRGGFSSLDELDGLSGFSEETVRGLKSSFSPPS
jgi:DNA uptake protein ComE-like DNA-binding protein